MSTWLVALRENVVINVEIAPPDCSEYNRALRLNAASSLLSEYLEYCEEPDNDEGEYDEQEL